jgi:ribosome-binding ATPase YchF (GTP1/OBG family)
VRAWTFQKGFTAPNCAGVIHSDFERGFIKAETVTWEDFAALQIADGNKPGMDKVKAAGKYKQEGKTYLVQDGDIILFQFNVSDKGGKKK